MKKFADKNLTKQKNQIRPIYHKSPFISFKEKNNTWIMLNKAQIRRATRIIKS